MNIRVKNLSDIIQDKIAKWYEITVSMLPNFVLSVVLLVVFYFVARFFKWLTYSVFLRALRSRELKKIVSKIVYFIILIVGLMTSLSVLELDKTVTSILASVGIIGLALGFAFQDIASNFISGFFMAIHKPFNVGDVVEVKDYQGTVTRLNLRTTELRTFEGNDVIIPNKEIFQNPITNYYSTASRRITVEVGVSYAEDLEHVREVTLKALESLPFILKDRSCEVFFKEFSDSSITFDARFWVEYTQNAQFLSGKSEAIMAIKRAFDKEGITIPFPIRTLDFGIKGGENLHRALQGNEAEDSQEAPNTPDSLTEEKASQRYNKTRDQHMDDKTRPKKGQDPDLIDPNPLTHPTSLDKKEEF